MSIPEIIIPIADAETLYKDYKDNRVTLIEERQNTDDDGQRIPKDDEAYIQATRSLTVDFAHLKSYIAFIEEEAQKTNTPIKGLRIYLGRYPQSGRFPDGNPCKYPSSETVFINPTMEFKGEEVSFAVVTSARGVSRAIPVGQIIDASERGESLGEDTQSLAGNTFHKRPPPNNDQNDFH